MRFRSGMPVFPFLWVPPLLFLQQKEDQIVNAEADLACVSFRKYKCWAITAPLPWGGILYIAGFVMREISVRNKSNLGIFIAAQVLLLAAPYVNRFPDSLAKGRGLFKAIYTVS